MVLVFFNNMLYYSQMMSAQCRAARALLDWTQQELAFAIGVGVVTIRQFEAGVGSPRTATTELLMNGLEAAGIEFLAGNGAGPGVRFRRDPHSREHFLAVLKLYDRDRLRPLARTADHPPSFGYRLVFRDRDGADLMYRDRKLGEVRWFDGRPVFNPPVADSKNESELCDVLSQWVESSIYLDTTGMGLFK